MEGENVPNPAVKPIEIPTPTKPASKSRYTSCLSSFRNNYKPPANFKPTNISSPIIISTEKPVEVVACPSPIPSLMVEVPIPSPFHDVSGDESPRFNNYAPLTGKGGNWRGPNQSDMAPESQGRQRFRQGRGFGNSRGGRDSYMGGQNAGTPPNQSFGRNTGDRNSSFNSSQGGFSPYNSSGNNSSNNRGAKKRHYQKTVDISTYYSSAMTEDPWAELVERRNVPRGNAHSQNMSAIIH